MDELVKIAFLLVTAPIWVPFIKAIRLELRALFELDGGVMGELPTASKRAEIEAEVARRPPVMVHEWIAHRRAASQVQGPSGGPSKGPGGRAALSQRSRKAVAGTTHPRAFRN